ncbi:MAG: PIN domain-containing protein [Planctomycetes bacterium]|nr:PIN domain-containing protein [Planctomycetota bacterium]
MKDSDKILVDTSAWIEFFRKKDPYYMVILELIDTSKVCCLGIILAELLQGAKSQKELDVLKEFLHVFDFLQESTEMWKNACELSYLLRQKGKSVGLSDCYISVVANTNDAILLTLDRHFEVIEKETGLILYGFT